MCGDFPCNRLYASTSCLLQVRVCCSGVCCCALSGRTALSSTYMMSALLLHDTFVISCSDCAISAHLKIDLCALNMLWGIAGLWNLAGCAVHACDLMNASPTQVLGVPHAALLDVRRVPMSACAWQGAVCQPANRQYER